METVQMVNLDFSKITGVVGKRLTPVFFTVTEHFDGEITAEFEDENNSQVMTLLNETFESKKGLIMDLIEQASHDLAVAKNKLG